MTISTDAITAVVLCGGRGRRMGGHDKPLLEYRGRPVVAHIVNTLQGNVAEVLISANRNLADYARYGTVIEDHIEDQGPLAGLSACLQRCATPYAFICPGDAPRLNAALIQRLAGQLQSSTSAVAAAHDGGVRQNLHLLMRTDAAPRITAYLQAGSRSVKGWLDAMAAVEVDCADMAESFADLDEPDDFARANPEEARPDS
jgi:molybdopterin-guanine dinucleotide biosynthesis protein A